MNAINIECAKVWYVEDVSLDVEGNANAMKRWQDNVLDRVQCSSEQTLSMDDHASDYIKTVYVCVFYAILICSCKRVIFDYWQISPNWAYATTLSTRQRRHQTRWHSQLITSLVLAMYAIFFIFFHINWKSIQIYVFVCTIRLARGEKWHISWYVSVCPSLC